MIDNWGDAFVDIAYFVSAMLFVFSIWRLSSPKTARQGNQLSMVAMAIALVATFFLDEVDGNYILIIAGLLIGAAIGYLPAQRVQMTAMPQMVAIFNGMGGATVALIAIVEFIEVEDTHRGTIFSIVAGLIIGSISATGSGVAFGKLQGLIKSRPKIYGNRQVISAGLLAAVVVLGLIIVLLKDGAFANTLLIVLFVLALVTGVLLTLPIGGADMPVVIAVLNAFTGLAAAMAGFALGNQVLVVAGALVGSSGTFLAVLMGQAMNRSVTSVLFGAFGAEPGTAGAAEGAEARPVRETTADDAAVELAYAQRVIIVPGYGLAVAQAQHAVQELSTLLQSRGVDVRYAIHPVAGRMPGHMNVLLAEANVPYDDLYEMEQINGDFAKTDVALVIGANDVTNPAAESNPGSPIYGMPILKVSDAQRVIVLKRGMSPGFAGVENELFHLPNTNMLFGDAKESLGKLIAEVRAA
jgi:NAD(P) transhydrogenase subunit beta